MYTQLDINNHHFLTGIYEVSERSPKHKPVSKSNVMGYQSFGAKSSTKRDIPKDKSMFSINFKSGLPHRQHTMNHPGQFTTRNSRMGGKKPVTQTMENSIQEFLDETKSIEEDLKKLRQLSVEKNRNGPYNHTPVASSFAKNHPKFSETVRRQSGHGFIPPLSGKKGKTCRTADNSLDREAIEQHLQAQEPVQVSNIVKCKLNCYKIYNRF